MLDQKIHNHDCAVSSSSRDKKTNSIISKVIRNIFSHNF